MKLTHIVLNKNRGWRGLAEAKFMDLSKELEEGRIVTTMVFSFSQQVWDDMQKGIIVTEEGDNYIIVTFDNTEKLPKGQRSVLLKEFIGSVKEVRAYRKETWLKEAKSDDYHYIINYIHNRNNHTTSDWNCVGIRVMPEI